MMRGQGRMAARGFQREMLGNGPTFWKRWCRRSWVWAWAESCAMRRTRLVGQRQSVDFCTGISNFVILPARLTGGCPAPHFDQPRKNPVVICYSRVVPASPHHSTTTRSLHAACTPHSSAATATQPQAAIVQVRFCPCSHGSQATPLPLWPKKGSPNHTRPLLTLECVYRMPLVDTWERVPTLTCNDRCKGPRASEARRNTCCRHRPSKQAVAQHSWLQAVPPPANDLWLTQAAADSTALWCRETLQDSLTLPTDRKVLHAARARPEVQEEEALLLLAAGCGLDKPQHAGRKCACAAPLIVVSTR